MGIRQAAERVAKEDTAEHHIQGVETRVAAKVDRQDLG